MSQRQEQLAGFVQKILDHLGIIATLEWKSAEGQDTLEIRGEGEDIGILLANGGKILYAMEYLMNLVGGAKSEGDDAKVSLDCNDFRALRSYELELLAKKAAEKVKTSQRPFPLQPMPANERRIVHIALVSDSEVKTESQGFGDNRRVIISPSK
jgi:spoIIIJ-associated protein